MKEIGGYFELELNDFGSVYHDNLIALNSGRNALEYILIHSNYKKVFIPYYSCDAILQPIKRLNIDYKYYYLDKNFLPIDVKLNNNDALLYVNYFGLMDNQIHKIINQYDNLIIDNAQAFFDKFKNNTDTFYSPRKFFGLPDGGFAYSRSKSDINLEIDQSDDRTSHLILRLENGGESGYNDFKKEEAKFSELPLMRMSRLTNKLMRNIQFEKIASIRISNFNKYHEYLKYENVFTNHIENSKFIVPMVYPFLRKNNSVLRNLLLKQKVFTATYWPNINDYSINKSSYELYLKNNMIPLPIDQRYNTEDIQRTLNIILKLLKN